MPLLRVALPTLLKNETTIQEHIVANSVYRWLKELKIRCRVFRNPIIYLDGQVHRPDIYIPALGLIIEVDGRSHERADGDFIYQQRSDEQRDQRYHSGLGVWVFVIPNWVAHNNYQLGMFLEELFKDFDKNRPTKTQYRRTAKAITKSRSDFQKDHPYEYSFLKNGRAGSSAGRNLRHSFGGFAIEIRPKRKPEVKPSKKPRQNSV